MTIKKVSTGIRAVVQHFIIAGVMVFWSVGAKAQNPEPAGWYTGDMHVHRSCGGTPISLLSIRNAMSVHDVAVVALLADMGNGEVENPTTDLPLVNGQDDPISTSTRIVHWDAEWHWDATYFNYPHQALGGHVVTLGLTNAVQMWEEYTYPILNWARQQGGYGGFAHMQGLEGGIPDALSCCAPIEYPVEVALGACDFISQDFGGSDSAMRTYHRLLNCGFRPGFAAGSDYPCNNGNIGDTLTFVQVSGALTYRKWIDAMAAGRTVVSRNAHNEFLDLKVNGNLSPGDEVFLSGSGNVSVSVQWTAKQNISGTIEIIKNGEVVASKTATVSSSSPQSLNTTVNFTKSGWLAARRTGAGGQIVHTAAIFVTVDGKPVRASETDAQYYIQWLDTLIERTSPGGAWASYFVTSRAEAQARYHAARNKFIQIAAEASSQHVISNSFSIWPGTATPLVLSDSDTEPIVLGMKFKTAVPGQITGIRYYKSSANTGTHVGGLWTAGGTLLATVNFANETASGWQYQALSAPVSITTNTTYVVSYHAPVGRYSIDDGYFIGSGVNSYPLRALAYGEDGPNGVAAYGPSSTFPTADFGGANYWVDVVFQPSVSLVLTNLAVTPLSTGIARGSTVQFTATGTYEGGSVQDLTSYVYWYSSNTVVSTVNASGLATGVSTGATTIYASFNGLTASASIMVTNLVQTVGDYRSIASGNWSSTSTWQRFNGTDWVAATSTPTAANANLITIRSPHTVTVGSSVSVDQVIVESGAQVTVNNVTWTIANGAGTDLIVHGTLLVQGTSGTVTTTGTVSFESGGTYNHARSTGTIPTAAWNTNSTCLITGTTGALPGGLGQAFGHFTWSCAGQSSSLNLENSISGIAGDFTVTATGSSSLRLANTTTGRTLTVGRHYIQSGGTFVVESSTGMATLNVGGDFRLSGGTFNLTDDTGTGILNVAGNFEHTGGTITETSTGIGRIFFNGSTPQTYAGGGTMANTVHLTVNNGATLLMGTNQVGLGSSGNFTNQAGGTLGIGHPQGIVSSGAAGNIRVTGIRTNSAAGNYIYNGTAAQVSGNGLPATVHDLTIANSAGLTINSTHVVNGTCTVTADGLLLGSGNINGPIVLNGKVSPGTSVGTLSTGPQSWYGGGSYVWELNNATGAAGSGYDHLTAGVNPIAINASSANKFRLKLVTLNGSSPGLAANFNFNSNYVWTIASGGGISGFDTNKFEIDTAAFQSPIGLGRFSLEQSGGNLLLRFTFIPDELAVATEILPDGDEGVPYTATLAASGGVLPYQWSIVGGTLPPGLEMNPASGSITGTAAVAGTYSFTAQVTDADSPVQSATRTYNLVIAPAPPILVVTNSTNAFTSYYAEILRTEGLSAFTLGDISSLTPAMIAKYDVLILGQMTLSDAQATTISNWVVEGGNLIAMRPDKKLAGLLGLTDAGDTLAEGYLRVNTTNGPGVGIVGETIQFHGTADRYTLEAASSLATLYSNASNATVNPAVTVRKVGANGGHAAAFTFDLARSVVYTRQGNPAWVGDERDGLPPLRSSDLFYGSKAGDPQPDWIDLNKVAIPQADEQQRLLANMIISMNSDKRLLPRFWYFPHGHRAAVVMTGDDHAWGATTERFAQYASYSTPGGSVDDWETIRSTSYLWTNSPMTDAQANAYTLAGFEVGLHLNTDCDNYTPASLGVLFSNQLASWKAQFPSLPEPTTHRMHCIVWGGYTTLPEVGLQFGIRLDTSYYYWPSSWVADRPGLFTGSGMVMRFATTNGVTLDVYQANTQMTDESGQSYPYTSDTLLDRALGPEGYYGFFVANMHTDFNTPPYTTWSDAIVQSAQSRGVPVISSRQLLTWLDSRNASSLKSIQWSNNTLNFTVVAHSAARGLQVMSPVPAGHTVAALTFNGTPADYAFQTVKGVLYAVFTAASGDYQIEYALDTTPPVVMSVTPAANAGGVSTRSTVKVKFSEPMSVFSVTTNTFTLRNASNALVAATVAYNESDYTATLVPNGPLSIATRYTATVQGNSSGVADVAGNALVGDYSWSFDVVPGIEGTLGNTNIGLSSDIIWLEGPWINAFRVQANTNWTLTALHAKVGGIAGKYKCAIYAGNATQPIGLLGETVEISSPTTDWRTFPLTSAVVVTNGQYYWLAVWSDDPNATIYYTDNAGTVRWEPYAYGDWPNPILTTSGGNFRYCIYASGYVAPPIVSIAVNPANSILTVGGAKQFSATATYSNGVTQNISSQARWVSTDTSVAAVNSGGLSSGLAVGTTQISASLGGVTGSTLLTVTTTMTETTTSVATSGSPSTYGSSVTFTATVTPNTATGTVDFFDGLNLLGSAPLTGTTTKTAAYTTAATQLAAGMHSITATYNGSGNHATSTSSAITQTVNALPVQVSGARAYDGTAIAAASVLTIDNNLDAENLTMTGAGVLSAKDVGGRAVTAAGVPVRVNSATGNSGSGTVNSFNVTVPAAANGNTLIAVIATRGTSANRVSGITQTGATWTRASQANNTSGSTTEIWYAPNVTSPGTTVTINLATSLRAAAVVMEYSGILTTTPLDQTAGTTSDTGTTAVTGTTPITTQPNELWIGGIGVTNSARALSSIQNSFSQVASAQSTSGTASQNSKVFALERIVSATGAASSGGTLDIASVRSGTIATFKAALPSGTPLVLGGSAAGNYTLTGLSGAVNVTHKALTVTGLTGVNKPYDGSVNATASGAASLNGVISPDVVTLNGTPVHTFAQASVGAGIAITTTGYLLGGADAGNYSLTPLALSADITPVPLTVTANGDSKTYDGLGYSGGNGVTYNGFVNEEGAEVLAGTLSYGGSAQGAIATGTYSIIPSGLSAANYSLTFVNGSLVVTPATLNVVADNATRAFGQANPLFTGELSGVQAGDDITATYSSPATPASPVGAYAINPSLQDPDSKLSNYDVSITPGVLTIVGMPVLVDITESSPGTFALQWLGHPGRIYRLQFKSGLSDATWDDLSPDAPALESGMVSFLHDAGGIGANVQGFYRVLDVTP